MMNRPHTYQSRRVWVIMTAAPLLWVGLWFAGRAIWQFPVAWVTLGTDLVLLLLVMVALKQRGQGLTDIGLKFDWLGREIIVGVLAGLGLWLAAQLPGKALKFVGIDVSYEFWLKVDTPGRWMYAIVAAISEEIIWRGFALTELHRLYRLSISVAIAVSAFALYHLGGALTIHWVILPLTAYIGGTLSALFLWRRSLVAPIVARMILGGLGFV